MVYRATFYSRFLINMFLLKFTDRKFSPLRLIISIMVITLCGPECQAGLLSRIFRCSSSTDPENKTEDNKDADIEQREADIVFYTFFSRGNMDDGVNITANDSMPETFDPKKKTKFLIHGFRASGWDNNSLQLKNAFLAKSDVNVFVVDWSTVSTSVYTKAAKATYKVGQTVGRFLDRLMADEGVRPEDLHLIGHSLGAHVCGFAARTSKKGPIGRISALDPASPGFDVIKIVDHRMLNRSDAGFVDVIHTSAEGSYTGIRHPIGSADFYPNGGKVPQPGCKKVADNVLPFCSHMRAWELYTESLNKPNGPFLTRFCDNCTNENYDENCCNGETVEMGDDTPRNATGVYYFRTNANPPYSIGNAEIVR